MNFGEKNLFYIYPEPENSSIESYLIYSTTFDRVRVIMSKLNKVYSLEYELTPIDRITTYDYEKIAENSHSIKLSIDNQKLTLTLDTPHPFLRTEAPFPHLSK